MVDHLGGVLGIEAFETTDAGYQRLVRWMRSHGHVRLVGVEGTGSYGAGLARHLMRASIELVEVDRRTGSHVIVTASPTRSTPSLRHVPRCPVLPLGDRRHATATSRRSGC